MSSKNNSSTPSLSSVLQFLNINGVTYQVAHREEFDKTYIKITTMTSAVNNALLSAFNLLFDYDERSNYYQLGENLFVTFENMFIDLYDDSISFAQHFLEANADKIIKADCIGGNVSVFMREKPDGLDKYLAKSQKLIGDDFITYTIKRDKTTLILSFETKEGE